MESKIPLIALEIIKQLGQELPKDLYYHSKHHTEDVIKECLIFAKHDALNQRETDLLIIAAAFHDSGFLLCHEDNEDIGAEKAALAMRTDGTFSEKEIQEVSNCILSTKLNDDLSRNALTNLSKYLLDADLGSLGREDMLEKTEQLAKEANQDLKTLLPRTIILMETHQWLTPAAKKLRQSGKEKNLKKIKGML